VDLFIKLLILDLDEKVETLEGWCSFDRVKRVVRGKFLSGPTRLNHSSTFRKTKPPKVA